EPLPPRAGASHADAIERLASSLSGEFDNHEQVQRLGAEAKVGTTVAALHVHHTWRLVDRGRDATVFLWHLQNATSGASTIWLYRVSAAADHLTLMPYRATAPAAVAAELADPKRTFKFEPEQWAALEACAQSGNWEKDTFSAAANGEACRALLP